MIDPNQSVASVVFAHSECAPVLQRHRLAMASGDGLSLAETCRRRGLDVGRIVDELEQAVAAEQGSAAIDPRALSDAELVDHIVRRYHDRARHLMPFLRGLSAKVAHVHGARHPALRALVQAIDDLEDALWPHLDDEEACLFLAIRCGEGNRPFIQRLVEVMTRDHAVIRTLLGQIRAAADMYRVPDGACTSYRLLFCELERLEADLERHLRLEDEVLMPRLLDG
jgi:regulator of cell morphogenesis and NO signaling